MMDDQGNVMRSGAAGDESFVINSKNGIDLPRDPADNLVERRRKLTSDSPYPRNGDHFEVGQEIFDDISALFRLTSANGEHSEQLNSFKEKYPAAPILEKLTTMKMYRDAICDKRITYNSAWKNGRVKEFTTFDPVLPSKYLLLCLFSERFCSAELATLLQICRDLDLESSVNKALYDWGMQLSYPAIAGGKCKLLARNYASLNSVIFVSRVYHAMKALNLAFAQMDPGLLDLVDNALFSIEQNAVEEQANTKKRAAKRKETKSVRSVRKKHKASNIDNNHSLKSLPGAKNVAVAPSEQEISLDTKEKLKFAGVKGGVLWYPSKHSAKNVEDNSGDECSFDHDKSIRNCESAPTKSKPLKQPSKPKKWAADSDSKRSTPKRKTVHTKTSSIKRKNASSSPSAFGFHHQRETFPVSPTATADMTCITNTSISDRIERVKNMLQLGLEEICAIEQQVKEKDVKIADLEGIMEQTIKSWEERGLRRS